MIKDYGTITSVENLAKLATRMLDEGLPVGFDVETGYHGKDFRKRQVDHFHKDQFTVGFSLTNSTDWARYVPLYHDNGDNIDDPRGAWEAVSELLTKGDITAHNAKFEMHATRKEGIRLASEGRLTDTIIYAYVINEYAYDNYRTVIGLKDLVLTTLGHQMMHIHELWPDLPANKEAFIRFNTLPVTPEVYSYACEDALWVLPLREHLEKLLPENRKFILGIENIIVRMMSEVEWQGVYIDWEAINKAYSQAQSFVPAMEEWVKYQLSELAERDLQNLNLNSPQQLKKLFFQDLGLTTTRLTKRGEEDESLDSWQKMSTSAAALTALSNDYSSIKSLLEYREVQNLNRRLKKWLTEYNVYDDSRVHPSYNQTQVPTGRFSAGEPAIQQLPKKWKWVINESEDENGLTHWSGNFRDFIVASPGNYLLTFDYSQAELRMLAGASQEPSLLEAFKTGVDIHTMTASQMLGIDLDKITPEDRAIGKTLNFALLYGQGIKALGESLGVSFERAKALYNQYFSSFSRVASWVNATKKEGLEKGYTETVFGRKIPVWELKSERPGIKAKGERILVNGPIQGAAADYMKVAMCKVYKKLRTLGLWENGVTVIMNQHDSLTFEISNSIDPNYIRPILQECVVFGSESFSALAGYPDMRADWELGQKWGSSTEWSLDQKAVFKDGFWVVHKPAISSVVLHLNSFPSREAVYDIKTMCQSYVGTGEIYLEVADQEVKFPYQLELTEGRISELSKRLSCDKIEKHYVEEK